MIWKASLTCRVTCHPSLERPQDCRHRTLVPTAQSLALCMCQQELFPGFPSSFGSASEFSSSQQSRQARLVRASAQGSTHLPSLPRTFMFATGLNSGPPCPLSLCHSLVGSLGSPASLEEDGLEGISSPGPQAISGSSSSIPGVLPSGQWMKTTEQARHAPLAHLDNKFLQPCCEKKPAQLP